MTAQTAPRQDRATPGGSAEPGPARQHNVPRRLDRRTKYRILLAIVVHILRDRRFQAGVITGVIRVYALGSLIKNNQARPVRRAIHWYNMRGHIHNIKVLHRAKRQVKSAQPLDPGVIHGVAAAQGVELLPGRRTGQPGQAAEIGG